MTCDEHAFRETARDLAKLYTTLDEHKHTRRSTIGERIGGPHNQGSTPPGNYDLVFLDRDLVARLRYWVLAIQDRVPAEWALGWDGHEIAEWFALRAQPICELPEANHIYDELLGQVEVILDKCRVGKPRSDTAAVTAAHLKQMWGTAAELAELITVIFGVRVTNRQITNIGRNPTIRHRHRVDGVRQYKLQDIVDYLTSENTEN